MSDETTLNPKETEMAVYQLKKVLERLLLDDHTVQPGSFSLSISGETCHGKKEVIPDKNKKVNLRFRSGKGIVATLTASPAEDMLSKKK